MSDPCPVVTMTPLASRDEVVKPASSAYAAAKPAPASPIGSTDTSAPGNQPEAITSPARREESAPMKSLAITIRTVDSVPSWLGPGRPVGKRRFDWFARCREIGERRAQ